jgi:predicted O-linked N-acetylglucosamine transferase (SPINDLY family)
MEQVTAGFFEVVQKIEEGTLDVVSLISATVALDNAGSNQLAILLYKYWLMANPEHHLRYAVAYNCGSSLLSRGDAAGAIDFLRRAIEAKVDFFPARINLGSALERSGSRDAAVAEWQSVVDQLALVSQASISFKVQALKNIARLETPVSADATEKALRQAIEIDTTQRQIVQHWINARQAGCMWPVLEPVGLLTVDDLERIMAPLSMSLHVDDPLRIKVCAQRESSHMAEIGSTSLPQGNWPVPESSARERLKIGYLSSDFYSHAVGYLIFDIFEFHDRSRYEISVFNIGRRTGDQIQEKVRANVDHWTDIAAMDDQTAAATISSAGIDILLDMNGHTSSQRTRILALRPAPIVVNWLGYPGTMGSSFHHYIIADDFIIPANAETYYSEKVLRLPCYQPNGRTFPAPQTTHSRADFGLPEDAVVYCCFNGSTKINERMFALWMQILKSVAGSVLWLRGYGADTDKRLRAIAQQQGVSPERLQFLGFRPNTEYLACHRHADIFLDTFPYGAHTTASDALRMAIPIVTLAGKGFASRVCGSLSRAAGMPDTVCDNEERYVTLAIELGNNKSYRDELKSRLESALPTCTLFNPKLLVESLETQFEHVWLEYCGGHLPVPNMRSDQIGHCEQQVTTVS